MSFALRTLWYERQRYLPGVLAVGFSALLITLQCGLLMGLFSITSIPVDETTADIWIGSPKVLSVDLGRPVPESFRDRLASQSEVIQTEIFMEGFAYWGKENGESELCIVVGSRLEEGSLGIINKHKVNLSPQMRSRLMEPRAIIVDDSDMKRLAVHHVGDYAEINGYRVRIVGTVHGVGSLAGPYVFCSIETARELLRLPPAHTVFVLGKCRDPFAAATVVERLSRKYDDMSVFTSDDFSFRTQRQWLQKTKAGIALGVAAALGLLVGAVVTSQTLYAATAASLREYAVLRALGIPRWRMASAVLAQSFWVGIFGIALAVPVAYLLGELIDLAFLKNILMKVLVERWWLVPAAAMVTMVMAMVSGLAALRSLRLIEPATLLR
jgi:putative ABC transport system permease protein